MGQSKQKNKSTALLFIEYVKIRAHSKREQGKLVPRNYMRWRDDISSVSWGRAFAVSKM